MSPSVFSVTVFSVKYLWDLVYSTLLKSLVEERAVQIHIIFFKKINNKQERWSDTGSRPIHLDARGTAAMEACPCQRVLLCEGRLYTSRTQTVACRKLPLAVAEASVISCLAFAGYVPITLSRVGLLCILKSKLFKF